jgi:hypothetical protein
MIGEMGKLRHLCIAAMATALLTSAGADAARRNDALVLVPTSGADLSFVPPAADVQADPAEEAMQKFRRAISDAALLERQQTEARCRSVPPQGGTREQRFAWAANCQYARR